MGRRRTLPHGAGARAEAYAMLRQAAWQALAIIGAVAMLAIVG